MYGYGQGWSSSGSGGGGGGGNMSFYSVTRAQMLTAIAASSLVQGSFYLITDRNTIVQATTSNTITEGGDFLRNGSWSPVKYDVVTDKLYAENDKRGNFIFNRANQASSSIYLPVGNSISLFAWADANTRDNFLFNGYVAGGTGNQNNLVASDGVIAGNGNMGNVVLNASTIAGDNNQENTLVGAAGLIGSSNLSCTISDVQLTCSNQSHLFVNRINSNYANTFGLSFGSFDFNLTADLNWTGIVTINTTDYLAGVQGLSVAPQFFMIKAAAGVTVTIDPAQASINNNIVISPSTEPLIITGTQIAYCQKIGNRVYVMNATSLKVNQPLYTLPPFLTTSATEYTLTIPANSDVKQVFYGGQLISKLNNEWVWDVNTNKLTINLIATPGIEVNINYTNQQ